MKIHFFRALLTLCILSLCNIVRSADQPAVTNAPAGFNHIGPRIQFAELKYDFGKVVSGAQVKHEFIFTNTGDATLEINSVSPACGCTTVGEFSHKVEPGQTGIIPLQFNSTNYNGTVEKNSAVTSNDKSDLNVTLQLHGTVFKPIDVSPLYVTLNVPPDSDGTGITAKAHIVNNDDTKPLTLTEPVSSWRGFEGELKTNTPGKDFDLIVKLVPPLTPETPQAVISMQTSVPESPNINVMALLIMQPPLEANPAQITLPPGPLASNATYTVSILHKGDQPIALTNASVNAAGVDVKINPDESQHGYTATVSFPKGFEVPFGPTVAVAIKTDRPRFPVLYVPIVHDTPPAAPAAVPAK